MQSYNEREKQSKIIEDLTNKYIIMENEKNELENLVNNFFSIKKWLRNFSKLLVLERPQKIQKLIFLSQS
jgi:hypothetical protein